MARRLIGACVGTHIARLRGRCRARDVDVGWRGIPRRPLRLCSSFVALERALQV